MSPHLVFIIFLFVLGTCVGSFLNVVIYRLPWGMSLWWPPSRCPRCEKPLAWYDNVPVLGWIMLGGRCRYCRKPISPQYPIIEAVTGILFAFYYAMFFVLHLGPCLGASPLLLFAHDPSNRAGLWPLYGLDMVLIAGLLAASVIDVEYYVIPASIPWWIAAAAVVVHGWVDRPWTMGTLTAAPAAMSLAAGAAVGLAISIALLFLKIIPLSFPDGDLLEGERRELEQKARQAQESGRSVPEIPPELTPAQVRAEMRKEMLFLFAPVILGGASLLLYTYVPAVARFWLHGWRHYWLSGCLGSLLGAMVGGLVVWLARILGSYGFGREAMGLGDVHLMFGIGAVLGAGAATVAFFIAPFFGLAIAIYMLLTAARRQLPYGPYLSLATAFVMLFYCPIAGYLRPGIQGLMYFVRQIVGAS